MQIFHRKLKWKYKLILLFFVTVGDSSVEKIEEFIQKCMTVLQEAIDNLEKVW